MSSKAKIMVVEDDIDEAKLTLMNGKEAQDKIDDEKPDFILLDVMMPEMDGFSFCSWLKSNEDYKDTPVVLLTGVGEHIYDSKYPLKGVMKADADEYLEKPLKPEVLLETISRLLNK